MKKFFLLISMALSFNCFAKECTFEWELKGKGLYVGKSIDKLNIKNDNSINLVSNFYPNTALRVFGVEEVKRSIDYDSQQQVLERQETIGKSKNISWKKIESFTYHRYINNELNIEAKFKPEEKIIDSTIFPYLDFLDFVKADEIKVKVFSSEPLYDAVIKKEKEKLIFISSKSNGYVLLDQQKQPKFFSFVSGGNKVEANRLSYDCR